MSQQTIITKELDTHDLWDAWNNGTPLSQSVEKFFNPKTIRRYRRLEKLASVFSLTHRLNREYQRSSDFSKLATIMHADEKGSHSDRLKEFHSFRDAVIHLLYRGICDGRIIAVGFSLPRGVTDSPSRIPDDLLKTLSVLDENSLEANGLKIDSIRLRMRVEMSPQSQPPQKELPPQNNVTDAVVISAGRPSTKSQIAAAYQSLNAEGKVDHSASKQECARNIHQFIISQNEGMSEDTKGFNIQTIVRHIRDQFDADKND